MDFAADLILKTTLVFALTGLLAAAWTKAPASARHLVLTLGLAGSLVLPALAFLLPRWEMPLFPRFRKAREESTEQGTTLVPPSSKKTTGLEPASEPATRLGHAGLEVSPEMMSTPGRLLPLPSWPFLLAALWAAGSAAALLRLLAGLLCVRRLACDAEPAGEELTCTATPLARSLGIRRDVRLLCTDRARVPMTSGFLRPLILLPREARSWSPGRRRLVLLHELAHVARFDGLSLLVVELAAAAYWFNPLVRVLAGQSRRECENAADDLVLTADVKPSDYATELLTIVQSLRSRPAPVLPTVAMARPAELEGRVRAILDSSRPRTRPARWSSRLLAGAGLAFVGALAALSPWAAPRKAEAAPRAVLAAPRPLSAKAWFQRAQDLHDHERWSEAAEAFQKAYEGGYREGTSAYNAACGWARLNERDRAFEWLRKAVDAGFDVPSYLDGDDDLDDLRSDARFRELTKTARENRARGERGEAAEATARYERLAAKPSADGSAWFQVGRDLHNSGRYDLAEKAYRSAAARGYREGTSLYNAACAAARRDDKAAALSLLKASLDAGFDDPDHMAKDDDLDNIRSAPEFRELEEMADSLTLSDLSDFGPFNRSFRAIRRSRAREVAKRFEAFTKKHPDSGRAFFNLGYAQLAGDRPEPAVQAFRRAFELGYRKSVTMYNLACSYARLDDKDKAFDWLFKSLEAGFGDRGRLRSDDDLDNLRQDPRFSRALRLAAHKDDED